MTAAGATYLWSIYALAILTALAIIAALELFHCINVMGSLVPDVIILPVSIVLCLTAATIMVARGCAIPYLAATLIVAVVPGRCCRLTRAIIAGSFGAMGVMTDLYCLGQIHSFVFHNPTLAGLLMMIPTGVIGCIAVPGAHAPALEDAGAGETPART